MNKNIINKKMSNDSEKLEVIKLMTLGNSKVGKTSFIMKYTENKFQEKYLSTIGLDFKAKNVSINGKKYRLFFYDTAGQERYKSISLNIIKDAQGIILMYDVTDKTSFESIAEWINNVKDAKGSNFPMVLVGNKIDLNDIRIVSEKEGKELAEENELDFFETSNKDGTNLEKATFALVNKILKKQEEEENIENSYNVSEKLTKNKSKEKSKRCC